MFISCQLYKLYRLKMKRHMMIQWLMRVFQFSVGFNVKREKKWRKLKTLFDFCLISWFNNFTSETQTFIAEKSQKLNTENHPKEWFKCLQYFINKCFFVVWGIYMWWLVVNGMWIDRWISSWCYKSIRCRFCNCMICLAVLLQAWLLIISLL